MFFALHQEAADERPYQMVIDAARFADENGFHAIWLPERHFAVLGGNYPAPAVLHAAIACQTRRVRLCAGSVVAPLHHPLRIAEDWSVVDNLSGGRVGVSLAAGWNCDDFAFAPERFARRHDILFETLETVRGLWRGEAFSFHSDRGAGVDAAAVRIYPRPIQTELPLWVTAVSSEKTFARAGAAGAHLLTHLLSQTEAELRERIDLYRRERAAHGHDPDSGIVTVMVPTYVGAKLDSTCALAWGPLCEFLKKNIGILRGLTASRSIQTDPAKLSAQDLDDFVGFMADRFLSERALVGTPETCGHLMRRLAGYGVNELACLIDFMPDWSIVRGGLQNLKGLIGCCDRPEQSISPPRKAGTSSEVVAKKTCADSRDRNLTRPRPDAIAAILRGSLWYELPSVELKAWIDGRRQLFHDEIGDDVLLRLFRRDGEALLEVQGIAAVETSPRIQRSRVPLSTLFAVVARGAVASAEQRMGGTLPQSALGFRGCRQFRLDGPVSAVRWIHVELADASAIVRASVTLLDSDGLVVGRIVDHELAAVPGVDAGPGTAIDEPACYELIRHPLDSDPTTVALSIRSDLDYWESQLSALGEATRFRELEQNAHCAARHVMSGLGVDLRSASADPDAIASKVGVIPSRRLLFRRLVQLATMPCVDESQDWSVVAARPVGDNDHEFRLLLRTTSAMPEILRGTKKPLEVLFPPGDVTVARVYTDTAWARAANRILGTAVARIIGGAAPGRRPRILETGGGTGAATESVLSELLPGSFDYVFSDVSDGFVGKAADRFGSAITEYHKLDIAQAPADQGFAAESFDVIFAANVIHATPDIIQALKHIRTLLRPGGILLLQETTRRMAWTDLVFGVTDGWWSFTDTLLRPDHPLLDQLEWQRGLKEAGFESVGLETAGPTTGIASSQSLLLASAPAEARSRGATFGEGVRWIAICDGDGRCSQVATAMKERLPLCEIGSLETMLPRIKMSSQESLCEQLHVLYFAGSVPLATSQCTLAMAAVRRATVLLKQSASVVRAASDVSQGCSVTVWLITEDAAPVDDGLMPDSLIDSVLAGAAGILRVEHPEVAVKHIELTTDDSVVERTNALLTELRRQGVDRRSNPPSSTFDVVLRQKGSFRHRFRRVPKSTDARISIDRDGTYLIAGGTGGLGAETARWLIARGARHLMLVSRHGNGAENLLSELRRSGAQVAFHRCDIADRDRLEYLITQVRREMPILKGVIHSAGVLRSGLMWRQGDRELHEGLSAKVDGAWNLHQLTIGDPLELFVLYSSLVTTFPVEGQGCYAAANSFLDALAKYRVGLGLPCLAIDWGPVAMVGLGRDPRVSEYHRRLNAAGVGSLTRGECISACEWMLKCTGPQIAVGRLDWARLSETTSNLHEIAAGVKNSLQQPLIANSAGRPLAQELHNEQPRRRVELLRKCISGELGQVLRLAAGTPVDSKRGFFSQGLDSLMALDFKAQLERAIGIPIPLPLLFEYSSVDALSSHLAGKLPGKL
ncbi:MAG TPA: MupA/Atu3671 family FMN-dependent luciferase-like monooxygenase [Pirellulales bacterium]